MAAITIIGAGYVGLVSGAGFASLGHRVTCLEVSAARLALLRRGEMPFYEPGLEEIVLEHRASGRLSFSDDYASVIPRSEFAFLAVDTPPREDGSADMSAVYRAACTIFDHARTGLTLVLKSTVPPGTSDRVARKAAERELDVEIVSNPEFLRQGSAIRDFLQPDRIVVGSRSRSATRAVAALYRGLDAPVIECSPRSAEMAKYAANALLATRVSVINEIAGICDATGANIDEVARIVGLDPRIGNRYLRAGLGWGGSCLPKDVAALRALAAIRQAPSPILEAVAGVNESQRQVVLAKLVSQLGELDGKTIGVLGLAFKPNTDDIRGAPSLDIMQRLLDAGAEVRAHDPFAMEATSRLLPTVKYYDDPLEVAHGADAILLATEWPSYIELDWRLIGDLMRSRVIVDGRNVLDQGLLESMGFAYASFGRASTGENPHVSESDTLAGVL